MSTNSSPRKPPKHTPEEDSDSIRMTGYRWTSNCFAAKSTVRPSCWFEIFHMVFEYFWCLSIQYGTFRHITSLHNMYLGPGHWDPIARWSRSWPWWHPILPLPIPSPLKQSLSLIKKIICFSDITVTCFLTTESIWCSGSERWYCTLSMSLAFTYTLCL